MRLMKFGRWHLTTVMMLIIHVVFGQSEQAYRLHLKNGTITPPANISVKAAPAGLRQNSPSTTGRLVVIQFFDIPDEQSKARLKNDGIELLEYIPDNAYTAFVHGSPDVNLLALSNARSLIELTAEQKIQPQLLNPDIPAHVETIPGKLDVMVSYPLAIPLSDVKKELESHRFEIISETLGLYQLLEVRVDKDRLKQLADLPWVQYIAEKSAPAEPLNDKSVVSTRASALWSGLPSGNKLDGKGVVIGIGDYGKLSEHIDVSTRVISHAMQTISWHGLHVAGTAAGAGIVDEKYRGYAPKAHLLMQNNSAVVDNASSLVRDFGMVVTNNAYGSGVGGGSCPGFGSYTSYSYVPDRQAIELPHLLHVFAAGNSGLVASCEGFPARFGNVIGDYTSAKNVMTVGRTTNEIISPSSSKGPVQDGRIKPELIAPGGSITSTMPGDVYQAASGTSMASPAVTGGTALLYQRYRQLHDQQNPKNALIKALLCNGASDKGLAGPDYSYGFGTMNLLRSVTIIEKKHHFNGLLTNNAVNQHQIDVPANTALIKVMLYWNDPAASPISGGKALVNNLDLTASVSGGAAVLPLVPNPAHPEIAAVPGVDSINNIEQIVVENPNAGSYTVKVTGTKIPSGPQEYFLVYDIIEKSTTLTYPTGSEHFVKGDVINISWDSYGNPLSTFAVSYSPNNGASWVNINSAVAAGKDYLSWTVPDASTTSAKIRLVQNETGIVRESGTFSIMEVPVISLSAVQCEGYATVQWKAVKDASDYEVMRLQDDEMKPVAVITALKYTFSGLSRDSTYYFSVRPRLNGIPGKRALAIKRKPDNGTCAGAISDGDLGIDSLISPSKSGRLLTSNILSASQQVAIGIRNFDDQPQTQAFQVGYSIGNSDSPVHWETVGSGIPAGGYMKYTFSKTLDLHNPGTYVVNVFVKFDGDPVENNNRKTVVLKQLPNPAITLPYLQDFESVPEQTLLVNTTGLGNAGSYDFISEDSIGRLRTYIQPGLAYSGTKALTLDANTWGIYEHMTSVQGTYNLAGYDCHREEVRLTFRFRQHGTYQHYGDGAYVRGTDTDPWIPAFDYNSTAYLPVDKGFMQANIDVSELLKKNSQQFTTSFQILWRQNAQYPAETDGYTIDDIRLFTTTSDLAMGNIIQPSLPVCNANNQELTVLVKNNGSDDCYNAPIQIMIDGDIIYDSYVPVIRAGKDTLFTAMFYSNLHLEGDHTVRASVQKANDFNPGNDASQIAINNPPVVSSFPYVEDFEHGAGGWQTIDPNSAWRFGHPSSTKVKGAASGENAWKTNLTGAFEKQGVSYLYSPCFDLRGMQYPTLSFSTSLDLESCETGACDIAYVEFSTGLGWMKLDEPAWSTNWYNYQNSWNVQDYTRWHVSTVRVLPWWGPYIRFRFVLEAKSSNAREGFAIDDVHVYDFGQIHDFPSGWDSVVHENTQGSEWIDMKFSDYIVAAINPNNQDLGQVSVTPYPNESQTPSAKGHYYIPKSFKISASKPVSEPVGVRFYFLDREVESLLAAPDETGIAKPGSAYDLAVTKYSGVREDGNLLNNADATWSYYPKSVVRTVPHANGYYVEFKTRSFSEFWLAGDYIGKGTPLPVTIVSFSAKRQTGAENRESVLLEWKTASEKDFSHFEIEVARSKENLLKSLFSKIGDVPGTANVMRASNYAFTDDSPLLSGTNYYRLKLVDSDGSHRYSAVKSVNIDQEAEWRIFPNPAGEKFAIEFEANAGELVKITINDQKGKQVLAKKISADGRIQKEEIDLSGADIPSGLYLIRVATGNREQTFKAVIRGH